MTIITALLCLLLLLLLLLLSHSLQILQLPLPSWPMSVDCLTVWKRSDRTNIDDMQLRHIPRSDDSGDEANINSKDETRGLMWSNARLARSIWSDIGRTRVQKKQNTWCEKPEKNVQTHKACNLPLPHA
eukprot:jgi/Bigna1/83042/fgenesh1_pg.101_\